MLDSERIIVSVAHKLVGTLFADHIECAGTHCMTIHTMGVVAPVGGKDVFRYFWWCLCYYQGHLALVNSTMVRDLRPIVWAQALRHWQELQCSLCVLKSIPDKNTWSDKVLGWLVAAAT
jgi:hypothetical protein